MINKQIGFLDQAFETLLDCYQMFDWNMSWKEYIQKAKAEMNEAMTRWEKESVGEEE